MKREWFKELSEEDRAIFKFLVENFDGKRRKEEK